MVFFLSPLDNVFEGRKETSKVQRKVRSLFVAYTSTSKVPGGRRFAEDLVLFSGLSRQLPPIYALSGFSMATLLFGEFSLNKNIVDP